MFFFQGKGLSKAYQGQAVISEIEVHVERTELVALLGVSGVGKTTLFNLLSGLERPDAGQVWLNGVEITGLPGKVSYMQQKDLLLPFKSILDNVSLPLLLQGVPRSEALKRARKLLPVFGLEDTESKYPSQLSGGMRQRAALLRSFLFSSEMLLLDEPFSALDAITKSAMHRWFNEVRRELDLTALLISHDIDEALLLANRIYIMAGRPGRVIGELSVDFSAPRDAELTLTPEFSIYKRRILSLIS